MGTIPDRIFQLPQASWGIQSTGVQIYTLNFITLFRILFCLVEYSKTLSQKYGRRIYLNKKDFTNFLAKNNPAALHDKALREAFVKKVLDTISDSRTNSSTNQTSFHDPHGTHISENHPLKESTQNSLFSSTSLERVLNRKTFSQQAQIILEKFYKKPLPQHRDVTVPNETGKMVLWETLSPVEQLAVIDRNKKGVNNVLLTGYPGPTECEEIIPRWKHGATHATRTAMEILIVSALYKKYIPSLVLDDQDIILAQYLTTFHDSARQAEGVDVWDKQSAENARPYLQTMGLSEDKIEEAILSLKSKDKIPPHGILGKLIHDADSLDIMRVYGQKNFQNKHLYIFNELKQIPGFLTDLEQVKAEIYAFIQLTETPLVKVHLETQSKNMYDAFMGLVFAKRKEPNNQFPLLRNLLQSSGQPTVSKGVRWIAQANRPLPRQGQYVIVKSLAETGGAGKSKSFIVADCKGQLFFFKEGDRFTTNAEIGASNMASFITGDLVPKAKKYSLQLSDKQILLGIVQPYVICTERTCYYANWTHSI